MILALVACLLLEAPPAAQSATLEDPWAPVRFMAGDWDGESEGQPGKGTVTRTYRFALGDRFLHERNVSTYPPQPKNEKGEVHEHWSFFSRDRGRRTLVLRQFHQEGFVNQYVLVPGAPGTVVFETEALENVPQGWKARETYKVISPDEFVETFELAQGAGPYEIYSQTRFKRRRASADAELVKTLEPLRFLLGAWQAEGSGAPGAASGEFTFAATVQGRVLVRASEARYPAAGERPASRHEDLMVVYATEAGELRADYHDSEGHVIRYAGSVPAPNAVTFVSEAATGAPRFRLGYQLRADGVLAGRFEIAPPGTPEAFAPYLAWTARRKDARE